MAEPAATWRNTLTPATDQPHPPIAPCIIEMGVTWNGWVNAGALRIEFAPGPDKRATTIVRSSAQSLGTGAALFPYQSFFWSEIDPQTLKPQRFHAIETDAKESTTTTTRYLAQRTESLEITRPLGKSRSSNRQRDFNFAPCFDLFSAMLWVRSQKLAHGERIQLVVDPFGTPYLLHVTVLGRELYLNRKAIRLGLSMRKINRTTLALTSYKKLKSPATLWISDDDQRIPLGLHAAVFIGEIRASITAYQKK